MNTKQLRQKILDLAIRGKLVPQDPNDEPASVLLERVRAEKEKLIKEGKIKRDKKASASVRGADKPHYENVPFEVPDGWVWCRLGDICNYGSCDSVSADNIKADAWILDLEDIEKDTAKILQFIKKHDRSFTSAKHSFSKGQVLYSKLRPYLNKVVIAPEDGYCTSEILPLSFKIDVCPEYVQLFLMSDFFLAYVNQCSYGVKMPRLGTTDGQKALFALPPLAEQKRIADTAIKAIEQIANLESEKHSLLEIVSIARQKILSLAIRGKLVPQDPNDEPASVLLDRIRAERENLVKTGKIKRGKVESVITSDDNSYYPELPEGWAVCRLEEVLDYEQPAQYIVASTSYNNSFSVPVLTAGKSFIIGYTNEKQGICNDLPVIIFDDFTTESRYVDFSFKVKSSAMKILRTKYADIKYLFHYMQTIECNHTTHKRYWISDFSQRFIALPPLAEQRRIIVAIETAFNQLDNIATTLA